jgi:tRNA A-37 threonylcarbamoyl transferase component Bud32
VAVGEKGLTRKALTRFIMRAPLLLSRHLWVWPLVGAIILSLVGLWVRNRIEGTTKSELASRLQTLLNADVGSLRLWFMEQQLDAKSLASDVRIQQAIIDLTNLGHTPDVTPAQLVKSPSARTLQLYLNPILEARNYLDYVVVGADKKILASPRRALITHTAPPGYNQFVEKALDGNVAISRPFAREASVSQRAEGPTMFVAAPVKSTNGATIAVLGLRMKPEAEFSRIFSVGRMGESGEAYAFDRRGMMLTASRFEPQLKALGLITNLPEATAILNLRLLDPGADLQRGERPPKGHSEPHLTRMAAAAVSGEDGWDVKGYRNYRGTEVVGAWAWLPEYGMGVATEVGIDEGFETLYVLRRVFLVLFLLLVLSGFAIFGFTVLFDRLRSSVRKNALTARRLGQYVLVHEIGHGASGMVYRARHALLRRPVAIKLLSPEMTNDATAARFEQEAQMTSQLTHPNTVAVYDYGRTPEGLFYYAMEYLSGIDLDRLVREFGPQPEGRVIHILRQVCGSLAEAHRIGLIHRDIKPANIVLTRRGGVCDVVKVLDFGLVKAVHIGPVKGAAANAVVGTPHYMSPEAIEKPAQVDGQSDLYSVGAVGYWLITGKTLFDGEQVEALLTQQVKSGPIRPSERLGRAISSDLEQLILRCHEKNPEHRLPGAEALAEALDHCVSANSWSMVEAQAWWRTNMGAVETLPIATMAEKTLVIAPRT